MKNTINIELNGEVITTIGDQLKAFIAYEVDKRSAELQQSGYLNIAESSKYCGMSRQTLKQMLEETGTEPYRYGAKVLYSRKDLDDAMKHFYGL